MGGGNVGITQTLADTGAIGNRPDDASHGQDRPTNPVYYQEIELRLKSSVKAHRSSGCEINSGVSPDDLEMSDGTMHWPISPN